MGVYGMEVYKKWQGEFVLSITVCIVVLLGSIYKYRLQEGAEVTASLAKNNSSIGNHYFSSCD